ncbi:MAG: delta-class carbonic anhydrase [Gammaproteobacteria bacterium]|nr:delta-class carbonic anhydrase [Gammaproteobacteria bacterium]
MKNNIKIGAALLVSLSLAGTVHAAGSDLHDTADGGLTTTHPDLWNQCGKTATGKITAGPQAPRDIDSKWGTNKTKFRTAFKTSKMNLCDIHYHWNAEHKSAAYSTFVDTHNDHSGWAVVEPASTDPVVRAANDIGGDHPIGVMVGDTIEVHFVHTSCNVNYEDLDPNNGLGNCATGVCANPQLRVVAQVFKVVDHDADVADLDQPMNHDDARVIYTGSTTGSKHNNDHCSVLQVTWDVKKTAATIDAHGLVEWSHKRQQHAHAVRELVTRSELLSRIKHDDGDDEHNDD